ncbi:MAG: copper resistance system multicopper oxidase [Pseudomonadales bacterium]
MSISRRRFAGLALGAAGIALSGARHARAGGTPLIPELTGSQLDLVVSRRVVDFGTGPRLATTINGTVPGPTLRLREGDEVIIRVHNRLVESTSIHWHGILLPYQMDGVPGLSFNGIPPGATFTYRFTLRQSGTYWYHSHTKMQELTGMYGALIVEPVGGNGKAAQRDHVVVLSDWSDAAPALVLARLKTESDVYNRARPTAGDFLRDVRGQGLRSALDMRRMWQQMRMNPTDLADVSASALNYLVNGRVAQTPFEALFRPGETVRLRCINAAAHTFFDVRIPGEKLRVIQADGVDVEPVSVDEFRIGPGETLDVSVRPENDACTLFAQSMDRSGFAAAFLTTASGLRAPIPAPDPRALLSMGDMMGAMTHAPGHGGQAAHHKHGQHVHQVMSQAAGTTTNNPLAIPSRVVRHARSEYGASVDMRVDLPRTNLDDPGVGLRNNGRRVLTLADLHSVGGALDARSPGREIELHLTGNMERYTWSFDGLEFARSTPVHFRHGERLRVILQNDTMMTHPMHLHGLWSELESPDGRFQVRRHTIPVQPAQRISFLVTADAIGRWAWHCHLMFHMHSGMFREVLVS